MSRCLHIELPVSRCDCRRIIYLEYPHIVASRSGHKPLSPSMQSTHRVEPLYEPRCSPGRMRREATPLYAQSRSYTTMHAISSPKMNLSLFSPPSKCNAGFPRISSNLTPLQLPPQRPRPPHELLILMFLHLQFPLPLHADRPHAILFRLLLSIPLPPYLHALHKSRWCSSRFIFVNFGAMGLERELAVRVGGFFDRQDGGVCSVLSFRCSFGAGGKGFGSVVGLGHRWWWGVEGEVHAGEDVVREVQYGVPIMVALVLCFRFGGNGSPQFIGLVVPLILLGSWLQVPGRGIQYL